VVWCGAALLDVFTMRWLSNGFNFGNMSTTTQFHYSLNFLKLKKGKRKKTVQEGITKHLCLEHRPRNSVVHRHAQQHTDRGTEQTQMAPLATRTAAGNVLPLTVRVSDSPTCLRSSSVSNYSGRHINVRITFMYLHATTLRTAN
jgi:hypothetical protein